MKKKTDSTLLTTAQICRKFAVHRHKIEQLVQDGMPTDGKRKTRGRPTWLFNPDKVAVWATAKGRSLPGLLGNLIKTGVADTTQKKTPDPETESTPILMQVKAVRSQFAKLFSRFLKTNASTDDAGVALLANALTRKGEELRRLEVTVLDYRQKNGRLVELAEAERIFVDLAMACRDRMMAIPNEVAPMLRNYLKRETDIGKVRDEIDKAVRHALESLPEKLPGLK